MRSLTKKWDFTHRGFLANIEVGMEVELSQKTWEPLHPEGAVTWITQLVETVTTGKKEDNGIR